MKAFIGVMFFLVNLVVFTLGFIAYFTGIYTSLPHVGDGDLQVILMKVGAYTGINGSLLIGVIGALMMIAPFGYAIKAYNEALRRSGGFISAIKHFAPTKRKRRQVN